MNPQGPFTPGDLEELDFLYRKADAVIPMVEVFRGEFSPNVIAVRHDVDDNVGSLDTALRMAEWEQECGYRTTYFLLHGSHYWDDAPEAAGLLVDMGHEVGIHVNALAEALRHNRHPHWVLGTALHELRKAVPVIGMVAHGDPLCHVANFVNDEMFTECLRPSYGQHDRVLEHDDVTIRIDPVSMWEYGIKYDANWLRRGDYLSDSGCKWSKPFWETVDAWPERGQLHLLQHPDWWWGAFAPAAAKVATA